jgi:site-specific DNA recombinase
MKRKTDGSHAAAVFVYTRVSTQDQVENFSLETQRRMCAQLARQRGCAVARDFIEEGVSAKTTKRPQLRKLLDECRRNPRQVRAVVVSRIDRWSRCLADFLAMESELRNLGIALWDASDPESSESDEGLVLLRPMKALIAQYDNHQRGKRSKDGMRDAFDSGRWVFQAPLGYLTVNRRVVPDSQRSQFIRDAFAMMADGLSTQQQVLARLHRRGLRTRRGKAVSAQTFCKMLRNPFYSGQMVVPSWERSSRGDFEALVSTDVFQRVQRILDGKTPNESSRSAVHPDFPLRGTVRCRLCRLPLTASWSTGRSGRKYGNYRCRNQRCRVNVGKMVLEQAFVELLARLQPDVRYARLATETIRDLWREQQAESENQRRTFTARLEAIAARRERLDHRYIYEESAIDRATYERESNRLNHEHDDVQRQLGDLKAESLDVDAVLAFAEPMLSEAANLWNRANSEEKRRLQGVFFPDGVPHDGKSFGTAPMSLFFNYLTAGSATESNLASPTGFEPVSWP